MSKITSWMTHAFRKRGIEFSPRIAGIIMALLILIGLLGAVRLLLVSYVVASARDLQETREALSELQQDNAALEVEIARMQSADILLERANEMNLTPVTQIEFLDH